MTNRAPAQAPAAAAAPAPATAARFGRSVDWWLGILLAVGSAYGTWVATGLSEHIPHLLEARADDVWFEADVARVFSNMTERYADHFRSQVHPLFSLLGFSLTRVAGWLPGMDRLQAVRLIVALSAAAWMAAFFALLRLVRCRSADATVFCLVAAASASALFWASIPETYVFGSLTIIIVLAVTALSERRSIAPWMEVGAAAAGLSMLVTNWMVALLSLVTRHKLRVAIQIAVNGFMVVVFLWSIQKFIFPSAHFFVGDHEKWSHVHGATVPPIFFLDTLVMPDIRSIANDQPQLWQKLSIQGSLAWKLTAAGPIALVAWALLLGAGMWALITLRMLPRFRLVLAASIAGQLLLHVTYGNESFLYALNWLPLLVTVAALTTLTRLRPLVLAVAVVFICTAAYHNYSEFHFALDALSVDASKASP